jgi:GDP-4-dehydro-6-deoxy-D-mannose reductase
MTSHGHELIEADVDVRDRDAVHKLLADARPDAIAHLAAIAFAPEAAADPAGSFAVAVGGTINIFEGLSQLRPRPIVLVTGSSEVYGIPKRPSELPLTEESPLAPATTYAQSKAAQEALALAYAERSRTTVVVTRSFSHTGPGQRPVFVVPAIAQRILAVANGMASDVPVGNLDVKRDMLDVRDVVVAYRLLMEAARAGNLPPGGTVVNVCSGSAVSIRQIVRLMCEVAGIEPRLRVESSLVRKDDALEVRGDSSRIAKLVGWMPAIPLSQTIADVWASTSQTATAAAV